jgi:sugar phosphate isomerase/epimerase
MTRRSFLAATASALPLTSSAGLLGIDSYTLRSTRWTAFQYLDYVASLGLNNIQFSEFPHLHPDYKTAIDETLWKKVRAHAGRLRIRLEMGTWGVCPTSRSFRASYGTPEEQLGLAIRAAHVLGATTVRCVIGNEPERKENGPIGRHIDAMIRLCRNLRDQALRAGVKIAIENHKELRADEMKYLVEQAGPDYVGVCLDTGNPILVLEDPLQTVETLAPYTVTTHFRDSVLYQNERGAVFQWVALGDGNVGIEGVIREFRQRCPGVPFNFEIITGRPPAPLPYLEPAYWKGFEDVPARDFARFVALARRGDASLARPPHNPNDPDRQKADLNRSLAWLRKKSL